MLIILKRNKFFDNCTIGSLFLDSEFFCFTLEDTDRFLNDSMSVEEINKRKIYGSTAIPYGIYDIVVSYSNRFKKQLPEILNVKGFSGIRIHGGNTNEDTSGCILVGNVLIGVDRIGDCSFVLSELTDRIKESENTRIIIMNELNEIEKKRLEEINEKIKRGEYDKPFDVKEEPLVNNNKPLDYISEIPKVVFTPDMTDDEVKEAIEILKNRYNLKLLLKDQYPTNLIIKDAIKGGIIGSILTLLIGLLIQYLKGC
jgi:hypothetical protein